MTMFSNDSLADIIMVLHAFFVLGVVMPVPLILIGVWRKWSWIRNRRFRVGHLSMMGIVVAEAVIGIACPLTVWEQALRTRAGEVAYEGSFIAHWVGRFLYYDFEPWVFTSVYLAFGGLILALYRWVPPKRSE